MKKISLLLMIFLSLTVFSQKKLSLSNFPNNKVMVISHRGDWRNAPENSVWAIRGAIEKGVNMAEIDLALTKDSVLVLMHDKTIDRTTTGKGKVGDYTLEEIKKFNIRDGLGVKTQMKIPTLEEILDVSKGKIFLNLDKGFDYISLVYPMLVKRGMLDEILFKGEENYDEFNKKYGNIKDKIHYMPILHLEKNDGWSKINDYEKNYNVYGYEFTVGSDESKLIDFSSLRDKSRRIWVNALWPEHNAGHYDDLSLENPNVYNWFVQHKINCVQTDRPLNLINFLKEHNLYQHD